MIISKRHTYNLNIALEAVFINRIRSVLTALGIIFGVAAVIAMMAIGNGARQEILEQIKMVGLNNILITPIVETIEDSDKEEGKDTKKRFSPGLTLEDAASILDVVPNVLRVSPEINFETFIIKDGRRKNAMLGGVSRDFFAVYNLEFEKGNVFTSTHMENASPVCVIGNEIAQKFFPGENPVGKYLKCGNVWLLVTGVLQKTSTYNPGGGLGINDHNNFIYAPVQTLLLRFYDRSLITASRLRGGGGEESEGVVIEGSTGSATRNINQLDKIVVQVTDSRYLNPASQVITRMIKRRHSDMDDFEVKIPESLLKQEQKTRDIFNIVLGSIAGIALIVGGIGIMNIMLASVMERIKEIGVRRALGARRRDVVFQFLAEATLISLTGGIIGILLGIMLAWSITRITGITTIISLWSIFLSFGVAATVGVVFGYMPARRAALQDPVSSLRYE